MKKYIIQNSYKAFKSLKINLLRIVLFTSQLMISIPVFGQVESFNLSLMNDGDLQQMLSKISPSVKFDEYDGSPYLFKEKVKGRIIFGNDESVSFSATFNLNFLSMQFFIYDAEETYNLDSSDVSSFEYDNFEYVRNDYDQFIKIIFKDENFTLYEKYFLEIKNQPYVVGYEKPSNKSLRVKKSLYVDFDGNSIPFKSKLKFLHSLLNTNINTLKNFIKMKSLKIKNHNDLKLIFEEFKK